MITYGKHTYGEIENRGVMNNIIVGKYCSIADDVIADGGFNHNTKNISTFPFKSRLGYNVEHNATCKGDIVVGNDVWIGEGVMLMSGITIGDGAVIAARSVVTHSVGSYQIVGGVPAKLIKYRIGMFERERLWEMKWWDWADEEVKEAAPLLMSNDINKLYNFYNGRKIN